MKKFISELGVIPGIEQLVPLYCDNIGAVAQAKEPRSHHESKHILRWFHLIWEIVERCDVIMERVDIKNNMWTHSLSSCQCNSLTAILIVWVSNIEAIGFRASGRLKE